VLRPAQHWRRLYLVDAATGGTRVLSPEGINVFEVGWSGADAVAVCTDEPSESAWYDAWIGRLDLDARTAERVYVPRWQIQCPRISPDGDVAWIEGFSSDRGTLTGTVHVLGRGAVAPELDATWIEFAGGAALWCAGWRGAGSWFGRLGLDGSFEELGGGDALIGSRFGPRVAPSADGRRFATTFESATEPAEVVLFEGGRRSELTALNGDPAASLRTAEWRPYRWESFDGLAIEGLLSVPRGHENGALPLAVIVHGGPTAAWPWSFAPGGGLPLLFAEAGYASLLPNPRGSVGQGPEFAQANLGDMGGGDLQDILAGVDALVRDGVVDGERVAIMGGSYGGFMASWAVTQTDRFAAAIPYAVVTNWLSFHNTTNIGEFDRLYLQADPYDAAGEYVRRSPVYHAARCTTPTLIVHGADDLCTPLPQAIEFYNALVEAGCETELVVYPREGHGFTEREHQLDFWRRIFDWLDRHLAG
jgi:dipeptidyl aminopeptidase/acylaminoacyl peptidase